MAVDDADPGLPIKWNPCSNAEYAPFPMSPVVREAVRRTGRHADDAARRLGMSRRRFLMSSMGSATALLALQACSDEAGDGSAGGTFEIPPEATTDTSAAVEALGGDGSPVFDVQNHFLEFDLDTPAGGGFFGSGFPQARCGDTDDPRGCFDIDHWIAEVFGRSDTTMAVLSAVPILGADNPLSAELMADAIGRVEGVCDDARVLMQGHAVPNVGDLDAALDAMGDLADRFPIAAWKTYTHVGTPFLFDDSEPSGAMVGRRFLDWVSANGPPIVAVHKGFSGGSRFGSPSDIGPAAVEHPELSFVIYHSGFESPDGEGPYDPDGTGIDRLIRSLADAGVGRDSNVYAELGSTWRSVMSDPTVAAHVLGKLLVHVGEDNICWGTDSIWYGSPQDQIESLRAFQITPEFQDRFGYPPLTDEIKQKILWRNSARIYGVTPPGQRCEPADKETERQDAFGTRRTYGPTTASASRRQFLFDHPWLRADLG